MAMSFGETDSEETMSRPFGVSLLVAGVEMHEGKPRPLLFHTDPSGTYLRYDAKAIGESHPLVHCVLLHAVADLHGMHGRGIASSS